MAVTETRSARQGAKGRKSRGAVGEGKSSGRATAMRSYDAFKEFQGKRYTGMAIGRRHHWRYDEGDWTEKKLTPDKWEIRYTTVKRRKGHAPEGSGVPVGTEYHWYVLADQTAKKLDANDYATDMVGYKFKLAHKRADRGTWSASEAAQRRQLVKILKQMIAELEAGAGLPAETAESVRANGVAPARPRARAKPRGARTNGAKQRPRAAA
jgi:hypothetical protein